MYRFLPDGYPVKLFVKEQNVNGEQTETEVNKNVCSEPLAGDSARDFYESVVGGNSMPETESSPLKQIKKRSTHKRLAPTNKPQSSISDLWKLAQNNDYSALSRLLRDNERLPIDSRDRFGWTPLMCASCSGAKECVQILIRYKADPNACDKFGNSALSLAKRKKFHHILNILEKRETQTPDVEVKTGRNVGTFFCQMCRGTFHGELNRHECSTAHLLNCPSIKTKTFYGIPDSNKGFQMLLKNGWDREKGLGSKECGTRFPVKVKIKNDRLGIGKTIPDISGGDVKKIDMEDPQRSLLYLKELESKGEEILTDRQEIVALDKRRNQTREGLRAIKDCKTEKTWLAIGPLLMKVPVKLAENLLTKDQVQVDAEINKMRSNLKVKVNDLRDMEHRPPVPGLMLNPLSKEEMKAFGQVIGRQAD